MKAPCQLLAVFFIALASCGSTRTTGKYTPAPNTTAEIIQVEPEKSAEPIDTVKKTPPKKQAKKNYGPFNVSLLLPLNLTTEPYKMDGVIADYYEGILMGLDSLKSMGMDIVVNVYDTKNDTATIKKITWKKELAESDVIIGPTFKSGHAMLSKYVQSRKITLVSPFSNANMWTDSNNYSLYCSPDDKSYAAALALHIKNNYPNANLLLFNDNTKEDKDFLWRFKVAAKEIGLSKWKDITHQAGWDITPHLHPADADTNIIIAPTDNEKIAQQLLTQLKDPINYNIVIALDSWLNFKSTNYQNYQLWEQNHLQILTQYYVDDYDSSVARFRAAYKKRFGTIPNDFAIRGFDHIMAMGLMYLNGQKDILAQSVEDSEWKGLHNSFKFRFNGRAIENRSVNVIEFSNYRFQRIDK
jgi:ABC-type branched-subunit amino acid transport system substrate-binding protein